MESIMQNSWTQTEYVKNICWEQDPELSRLFEK